MKIHITPKSAFSHLFLIAMLYASLIAVLTVIFQYVNLAYPDTLTGGYYSRTNIFGLLNWGSAVLVIAFPALLAVSVFLEKEFLADELQRQSPERKWLLYLTQFVTALTIVISLMALVYNFYNGGLTMRFGLKVLATLVIAAAVLGYYRWELVRSGKRSQAPLITAVVSSVCVLLVLGAAFFIGASPQNQRAEKFDQQRMDHLSSIQSQLISFWQVKKVLPNTLDEMNNTLQGYIIPKDPETTTNYTYKKTSDLQFELCATFGTKSYNYDKEKAAGNVIDSRGTAEDTKAASFSITPYDPYQIWLHTKGEYCFTRTIDPDYYKTVEPAVSDAVTTSVVQ
jgi:hypothetical protein